MGRNIGTAPQPTVITQQVPIGSIANVFRAGDAYRAANDVVSRAAYPALSAAFPRNGSFTSMQKNLPSSDTWVGLVYGLGMFVLMSASGFIITSPDGENWTSRASVPAQTSRSYNGLAFGNGKFVAVAGGSTGGSATSYVSTDLLNWTAGTMPNSTWSTVGYGTQFVALATGTAIAATSVDGINWTQRTLPSSDTWSKVVYGGGVYFAFGMGNGTTAPAASSPDGITWTARTLPAGTSWKDCAYGNGAFIICGIPGTGYGMARSTDGAVWTEVQYASLGTKVSLDTVAFGNGLHVATTGGTAWVSYDGGLTWAGKSFQSTVYGKSAVYGKGRFFGSSIASQTSASSLAYVYYAETTEGTTAPSDDLYLIGTAGTFVRVK